MRRWPVAVLLCLLISSAVVAYIIYLPQPPKVVMKMNVGIFYYVWYGAPDSPNWSAPQFVDYPVLGNYSSSDPTVIKRQLVWMKDLGIDFAVISWWGFYSNYEKFIDNAAKQVLEVAEDNMIGLKFAIMVEPSDTMAVPTTIQESTIMFTMNSLCLILRFITMTLLNL